MKKAFKFYAIVWAILFAAFNVICFVTPNEIAGLSKIDATFWVAYAFVDAAFIGNLICAYFAFKADNAKKMFYNLSLITVSYTGLIVMLVVGAAAMAIPFVPSWVAVIVCVLVLAFCAMAVVKAAGAVRAVENVDEKIKEKTFFIKNITVDADSLVTRAKSDAVKTECVKVYEALRYSDPMSNEALKPVEDKISSKLNELTAAVGKDDAEKAKEIADEIVILVGDRNKKCKVLK